jgi:hypothetical protein
MNIETLYISGEISQSNYVITETKNQLPQQILKTFYVNPLLLYCLPVYSCSSAKNITKLFSMQKRRQETFVM